MEIEHAILKRAQIWLNGSFDDTTKTAVKQLMETNPGELTDSFYRDLEFGTGGLRGVMGVGTNRMNKYTVGMATQNSLTKCAALYAGRQRKDMTTFANWTMML